MRVLVIESGADDGCAGLVSLLVDAGHEVARAVSVSRLDEYDLVILTRSAASLVRDVRDESATVPLLVLTEEGCVEERVRALEAGADDALAVPFAPSQAMARVGALGRRGRLLVKPPDLLEVDGCFIDFDRLRASRDDRPVELSKREADLLRWLHRHRARAVSRRELLEHVFGVSPEAETRSVDMAIAVLRKKIERDAAEPRIIRTVKGVGYGWIETP